MQILKEQGCSKSSIRCRYVTRSSAFLTLCQQNKQGAQDQDIHANGRVPATAKMEILIHSDCSSERMSQLRLAYMGSFLLVHDLKPFALRKQVIAVIQTIGTQPCLCYCPEYGRLANNTGKTRPASGPCEGHGQDRDD